MGSISLNILIPLTSDLLEKSWEPRDSTSWLQVMDLIISMMERLDVAAMAASAPVVLTEKICVNVLSPARLVVTVLTPGLSEAQPVVVRTKSCHLLAVILANLDTFVSLQQEETDLLTTAQAGLAKLFTGIEIWQLWELLAPLLDKKQTDAVLRIIRITKFWVKMFQVSHIEGINISEVLQTVQAGDLGEDGVQAQLLILELMNVMILNSGAKYSHSLRDIYSEDTFRLLLKIITSSQEEQKKSATETFSGRNLFNKAEINYFSRLT